MLRIRKEGQMDEWCCFSVLHLNAFLKACFFGLAFTSDHMTNLLLFRVLILIYLHILSHDELFDPLAPHTLLFRQLWSTVRIWFHAPCFSNWILCSITDGPIHHTVVWFYSDRNCVYYPFCARMCMRSALVWKELLFEGGPLQNCALIWLLAPSRLGLARLIDHCGAGDGMSVGSAFVLTGQTD